MENWVKRLTSNPLTREELGTLMQETDRQNKKGEIPWITLVKKLVKKLAKCGSQILLHNISKVIRSHIYQPMKGEMELPKKEAAHLLEAYSSLITYINHSLEESDLSVQEISRLTSVILPAVIDMKVLSLRKKSDVAQSIYNKITLLLGESSGLIADALLHCRTLIFTKLRDPAIFIPIIRLFFASVKRNKSQLHSLSPELYLKYLVLGKFWLFMSPREEVSSVRTYICSLLKMPPSFEEWSSQANISWLKLKTFNTKSVLKAMVISTALQTIYSKRHSPKEKKAKQKVGKKSGNDGQMCSSIVDVEGSNKAEEVYNKDLNNKEEEESVKSVQDSKDKTQNRKSESQKEKRKTFYGTSDVVCQASKKKKHKVMDTETESGICKGLEEEKVQSHGSSNLSENSFEEVRTVGTLGKDKKEAKAKLKKKKKAKLKESMDIEGANEESEMSSDRKKQDSALESENNSSLLVESLEFKRNSEVLGSLEVKQMNDAGEEVDEGKVKSKKKKKVKHKECVSAERVNESEMGDKNDQSNKLEVKNVSAVKGGVILESFETEGNEEMQLNSCEGEHKIKFGEESKEGKVRLKKKTKSKKKKSLNTKIPEGNDNSEVGDGIGMEFMEQKENSKMDVHSMGAKPMCQLGSEMTREKVKLKKKKKNKTKESMKAEVNDDEKSLNDVCESEGVSDILESLESKGGSERLHTCLTAKKTSTSKSAKEMDKEVKLKKKKKGKEKSTLNIEIANKSKMSDDTKLLNGTCESPNMLVSKGSERLEALGLEENDKISLNTFEPKQESEFDKGNELKMKKKVKQKNTVRPEKASEDSEVVHEGKGINGNVKLENAVKSKKTGKSKKGEQKDTICAERVSKEIGINERTNSKNALPEESGKSLLIASEKSSMEAPLKVKKSKALKKKNNEVCELQESETVASYGKGAPPAKKKKIVEKCDVNVDKPINKPSVESVSPEDLAPMEQSEIASDIASQTRKKRRKKKMSMSLDESQSYDSDSKQAPYKEPKIPKSENTGKQSGISVQDLNQNSHISADTHDNTKNIEDKISKRKDKITGVSQSHQKKRKKLDLGIKNLDAELGESSGHPGKQKKKRRSAVARDSEIECEVSSLESESSILHDKDTQLDGSGTPCAKKPRIDKDSLLKLAEGKDIHKKKKFIRKIIDLMLSNTDQEIQLKKSILTTLTEKGEKVTSMTGKQIENKSQEQKYSKEKRMKLKKEDKVLSSTEGKASVSYEDVPKENRGWSLSPPHSHSQKERLRTSSWDFTVTKLNWDNPRDAALALVEGSPEESVQSKSSDKPSKNTDSIEKLPCQIVASPKAETSFAKSNGNDSDLDIIYQQADVEAASDSSDEIDEASGSPGDIVPCDEVNKMFTDEETRVYHEKLLKANMPQGSGALIERETRLASDCIEEASQLSVTEYEPVHSDNKEGLKAILETIVRDTGKKSSIEGLKEEYVFSSSSSDVVVLSEENDDQEAPSLEEELKKDIHERETLRGHGSTASSVTRQISNGSNSTELPCLIEPKPIQEVQSISNQDKEDVGKYVALNSATPQKEPIKPHIDAGCNDSQKAVASCRNSQSESMNEILRVNTNDMQASEQVQVPSIKIGLENGSYSSVDVDNDEISNSSSSKGDADVDYSVCISGKPNDDTREEEFLGNVLIEKSNELRELNIETHSTIHDSFKNSEVKELDNGAETDLQDSPKNSKLEDIDIVEDSNLQDLSKCSELNEKDTDADSYLQVSPKNSQLKEVDTDEGSNLQYSLKSGEGKDLYIDAERKSLQDLPENSELEEIHIEAENNLQDSPKNLFTLIGKGASDAQSNQRETPSKLKTTRKNLNESPTDRDLDANKSVDYINSHANTANSTADDFHNDSPNKKIAFERAPDGEAGINLQNKSNFTFSEGTTQWEVCKAATVENYLKNDCTIVTDKEKETDLEIQNDGAPLSLNGIEVVAFVNDTVTGGYKPESTLTSKGDEDKLSESYENVLCNDGDEAYEASSDASEEPTPVSRRKTRSQRKAGPLLLKTDEASDSDFSPLRRSQRGLTLEERQKVTGGDAKVDVSETSYTKAGKECSLSESDDVVHHDGVLASDVESVKKFSLSKRVPLKKIERRRSRRSYSSSKEYEISPMQVKTRRMRRQCFSESEMGSYCVERGFLDKVRCTRKTKYSSTVDKDDIVLMEECPKEKILVDSASPSKRMSPNVQRSLIPAFSEGCQKEVDITDGVTASLTMGNENKGTNNSIQDSALQNGHCSHSTDKNTKSSLLECSVTSDGQKVSERIEDFDDEQVCLDENKEEEAYSFRELLDEEEGDEIEVLSTSGLGDSEDGLECNVAIVNKKTIKKYKTSSKPACVSKKLQQNYSQRKSSKQSPLGKKSEPFTFTNKDSDKLEIPQLKAQCVSEAVLAKEVLISPDVSDEECELVLPSDSGGSEMKKNASSSEGLCELLKKLPEESKSKIGIKPWSRRGGIRSPQKVIPEEQDETSFSRKKSSPNKVLVYSSDTGKSSDEDIQNLGHSSEILPKRSDRRLSLVKNKSVKNSNCNHSSVKNVRCGAEATEEEISETQDKYSFGSKRRKRGETDEDEGSSSARVTRSGVKKAGTSCVVSPSKKDPCTLLTESMSDSNDKGDSSSVKSDYSPRILRSRRASKNSALSVTPLKKRESSVLKKGVTDESNSSDSNEKHSRCNKLVLNGPQSVTQKDDAESEKEGSGEIDSSSEKRNPNTENTRKSSTRLQSRTRCGDKVGNVLTSPVKAGIHSEPEEKSIVGIEKNKSVGTKDSGVSEKRHESSSQNKNLNKEQKLSPLKRRTRLSCAKHIVGTEQEERQQTQQEIASQSGTSQVKIRHQGKITSLPHSSEELEVSPLQKLPQEPSHPPLHLSNPLPKVSQLKTTTTEISSPIKDTCSKTSAVVVSSPSPTKTITQITVSHAQSELAQKESPDPPKESPNQPVGKRTRRAQLMPNEAKNAGVSSS